MIVQALTSSFKAQILLAVHDFRPTAQSGASIFKAALYTSLASLDANTTAYTSSNEVVGTGYTAGGLTLTNVGVTTYNTSTTAGVGFLTFSNATWSSSTLTARGALIYNTTPKSHDNADAVLTNPAVCVLDFGSDKTTQNGNFTIQFPPATYTSAIIRIS